MERTASPSPKFASMGDVFGTFLRLGLTSFGGPIAHLAYFRRELVERRRWLTDDAYMHVVAFCSALPGPTSSQVGMVCGLVRAGPGGAFAAWLAFTAPSALLMGGVALALHRLSGEPGTPAWVAGLIGGLTAAAAGIIAQAVVLMWQSQCRTAPARAIACGAGIIAIFLAGFANMQWLPIAFGAGAGALFFRERTAIDTTPLPVTISKSVSVGCAVAFVALAVAALTLAHTSPVASFLATIVRAGSLVFGGGHVVLPLLRSLVTGGFVPANDFYAGYGAVQAMPGPISTFATFLGTANATALHGAAGAAVATLCIFAPSFLLLFALLPVWNTIRSQPAMNGALRGANASVVGLLGAVLYSPILTSLGAAPARIAIAAIAFALVALWKIPPWIVVSFCAVIGSIAAVAGAWS